MCAHCSWQEEAGWPEHAAAPPRLQRQRQTESEAEAETETETEAEAETETGTERARTKLKPQLQRFPLRHHLGAHVRARLAKP